MPQSIKDVVNIFIGLINPLLVIVAGASLFVFFKGLATTMFKSGDEKALGEGRDLMKWGILALFIMICLWGMLSILYGTFGFSRSFGIPLLP